MKKIIFCFFFLAEFSIAMAAEEIPNDLLGKWVGNDELVCTDKKFCECARVAEYGFIVGRKSIRRGIEETCEVKKISRKNGLYKISQKCVGREGNRNITKSYLVQGESLTIQESDGEHNWEFKYKRCPD